MKEVFGNLWDFDGTIAITTNSFVKRDGSCVMGRGCAKEAAVRFEWLPRKLGAAISKHGNHVFYFPEYRLITFPVKHVWWEPADPKLIERSARELLETINNLKITNRTPDFFEIAIDIEVSDAKHLTDIIAALRAVPQVTSVDRARG